MRTYEGDQRTLGYMLRDAARQWRGRDFVYYKEEKLTYGEVDDRSSQIANALIHMGLARGSRVGVFFPNCPDFVLVQFGVAKAGMVEVPYNTEARGAQLVHFLNNSDPDLILIDEQFLPLLKSVEHAMTRTPDLVVRSQAPGLPALPFERKFKAVPFRELLAGSIVCPEAPVSYTDLLAIFYTSGTTGLSKGVMLPHNHNWHFPSYLARWARLTSEDIAYCPLPYYHGVAQYMSTVPAMLVGGGVALGDKFTASRFWEEVRKYRATSFWSVYTMPSVLMNQPPRRDDADNPLRVFFTMGIDPKIQEAFEKRFNIRVLNCYGSTEQNLLFAVPYDETKIGSSGKVTQDFEVAIVDEKDNILPAGKVGEIVSRPRQPYTQMLGYYRMPEETLKATRNLWLHSGELGYVDEDGWFFFAGRAKDAIRKGGENVSAEEVEGIVNSHPAVLESACIGVRSELGEDEIKIDVVLKPGQKVAPAELLVYCEGKMARHMLPRYVQFRTSLPKTGTEKLQKVKLREEGVTPETWDRVTGKFVRETRK